MFCSEVNSLCSCGKFATPKNFWPRWNIPMSQTQPSNSPSISAIFSGVSISHFCHKHGKFATLQRKILRRWKHFDSNSTGAIPTIQDRTFALPLPLPALLKIVRAWWLMTPPRTRLKFFPRRPIIGPFNEQLALLTTHLDNIPSWNGHCAIHVINWTLFFHEAPITKLPTKSQQQRFSRTNWNWKILCCPYSLSTFPDVGATEEGSRNITIINRTKFCKHDTLEIRGFDISSYVLWTFPSFNFWDNHCVAFCNILSSSSPPTKLFCPHLTCEWVARFSTHHLQLQIRKFMADVFAFIRGKSFLISCFVVQHGSNFWILMAWLSNVSSTLHVSVSCANFGSNRSSAIASAQLRCGSLDAQHKPKHSWTMNCLYIRPLFPQFPPGSCSSSPSSIHVTAIAFILSSMADRASCPPWCCLTLSAQKHLSQELSQMFEPKWLGQMTLRISNFRWTSFVCPPEIDIDIICETSTVRR